MSDATKQSKNFREKVRHAQENHGEVGMTIYKMYHKIGPTERAYFQNLYREKKNIEGG